MGTPSFSEPAQRTQTMMNAHTYSYDRRKVAATWDSSVLGLTQEELDEMDDEERKARLAEELNRAADILQALATAFKKDLGSDKGDISQAAREIIQVARKVHK